MIPNSTKRCLVASPLQFTGTMISIKLFAACSSVAVAKNFRMVCVREVASTSSYSVTLQWPSPISLSLLRELHLLQFTLPVKVPVQLVWPLRLFKTQLQVADGCVDATFFRNQFITNQYKNCNNVRRGAIYYLENGARFSETNSSYTDNSALEGGIAYLKNDGTT